VGDSTEVVHDSLNFQVSEIDRGSIKSYIDIIILIRFGAIHVTIDIYDSCLLAFAFSVAQSPSEGPYDNMYC